MQTDNTILQRKNNYYSDTRNILDAVLISSFYDRRSIDRVHILFCLFLRPSNKCCVHAFCFVSVFLFWLLFCLLVCCCIICSICVSYTYSLNQAPSGVIAFDLLIFLILAPDSPVGGRQGALHSHLVQSRLRQVEIAVTHKDFWTTFRLPFWTVTYSKPWAITVDCFFTCSRTPTRNLCDTD